MGKQSTCMLVCALSIIVMFGIFTFLMTMVNPAPIVSEPNTTSSRHRSMEREVDDYIRSMPSKLGYGLEKVSESEFAVFALKAAQYVPHYRELANYDSSNDENVAFVRPPLIPSRMNTSLLNTTLDNEIKMTPSSVKGFRRSVADLSGPEIIVSRHTGIILKILDDRGDSRIEIKLNPTKPSKENNFDRFESESIDEDFNDDQSNKIIKTFPNNTLLFEDNKSHETCLTCLIDNYLKYNASYGVLTVSSVVNGSEAGNYSEEIINITESFTPSDSQTKLLQESLNISAEYNADSPNESLEEAVKTTTFATIFLLNTFKVFTETSIYEITLNKTEKNLLT